MLPRYALPPHIYLCRFATAAVLLDLQRNRYLGIDAGDSDELTSLLDTAPRSGLQPDSSIGVHDVQPKRWVDRGLLELTCHPSRPFAPNSANRSTALTSLVDARGQQMRIRPRDVTRFIRACLRVRRALRTDTLWRIACDLHARRTRLAIDPDAKITELTQATMFFRSLRPLAFAAREQCLFHALALTWFLTACRLPATWIIGVRLHPWGAHSWVQHGSMILDATPESVHEYQPIVAV